MLSLYELRKSVEINWGHNVPNRQVAKACGMSLNKYFRAERGDYIPNALELVRLAEFFKITIEALIPIIEETVNRRRQRAISA